MMDHEMDRRRRLARQLIEALAEANVSLDALKVATTNENSEEMDAMRRESDEKLQAKRNQHQQQILSLKEHLANITGLTNDLHAFREDTDAQKRWSYPLRLLKMGREANAKLKEERAAITALVLQHRLLEEDIRRLSDTVSREALARVRQTGPASNWTSALESRQRLLDDLILLLPAIPDTARCTLDPAAPRAMLERLA